MKQIIFDIIITPIIIIGLIVGVISIFTTK